MKLRTPKQLFQLYLEPEQVKYIAERAEETMRTRASIVREIINEKIKKKEESK